eukprot:scpid98981/ scgid12350/ 
MAYYSLIMKQAAAFGGGCGGGVEFQHLTMACVNQTWHSFLAWLAIPVRKQETGRRVFGPGEERRQHRTSRPCTCPRTLWSTRRLGTADRSPPATRRAPATRGCTR